MANPLKYELTKFDSGLRLLTIPMEGLRTATVLVLVGTGSKYEDKRINGISHFLEHMMFKGTTKRPGTLDISKELDSVGASYNAFTGKEHTGYYAKVSADKVDVAMDVISDIFLNSKLDEKDIEIEKGVIIEEINMYKDMPNRYVGDLFENLIYGDQPAGWDIVGSKEIVASLKKDDFIKYFNSHYVAQDTIVTVAGNIDPKNIKGKIVNYFKNVRTGEKLLKEKTKESQSKPQTLIHFKETDQSHFILGVRSFDMFDQRKYALGVLANILGGGMSSRLFSEVREKRGLAYYVSAGNQDYTDSGYFAVNAGVNKEKTFEAIKVVLEELRKVLKDGITEDELQRSKDQITGSMALHLEHSDSVAEAYSEPVLYENKVLTPEEILDKINKLKIKDINQAARDIIKNESLNFALIGPFKEEEPFKKILKI